MIERTPYIVLERLLRRSTECRYNAPDSSHGSAGETHGSADHHHGVTLAAGGLVGAATR